MSRKRERIMREVIHDRDEDAKGDLAKIIEMTAERDMWQWVAEHRRKLDHIPDAEGGHFDWACVRRDQDEAGGNEVAWLLERWEEGPLDD